jgi:uncharacterized protein
MQQILTRYHVASPSFYDAIEGRQKRLIFSTRTATTHLIDEPVWNSLSHGDLGSIPSPLLSELSAAELLVDPAEDELSTVVRRQQAALADDTNLVVVIQPTALCQLGCVYCGQEHKSAWLSPEDQQRFLRYVETKLSTRAFRRLSVCWFGAEPLSGISVIRTMTPKLKSLAAEFECAYGAATITNGLALTTQVATEITHEHSISEVTISLDGIAKYHDARRATKQGLPTFDPIFANLVALARRDDLSLDIKVRANVDRHNADGVLPLLELLAEKGIQRRISFYATPIHSWGNDAHLRSLSPEEFASLETEWHCAMIRLGFTPGLIPHLKPIVCLAVRPNGILVDANGELFNCTEVSYVPAYGKPNRFAIGDTVVGEQPGARDLLGNFNDRVLERRYPCASCRMLPVCGGACPKAWLEGHEPCPSAKQNIEQRLLLAYASTRLQ